MLLTMTRVCFVSQCIWNWVLWRFKCICVCCRHPLILCVLSHPLGNPGWHELKVPFLQSPSAPCSQVRVTSFFFLTIESRSVGRAVRRRLQVHRRGSSRPVCSYLLHPMPARFRMRLFLWYGMCSWLWLPHSVRARPLAGNRQPGH